MMSNNKILTVSYGTFSCTLEGFEDSFGTMKAIAEYFRELSSDAPYFGAEPPQPDADMLARIAQREISKRVEAREQDGSIHLSARDDAQEVATDTPRALPSALAAPAAVAAADEATEVQEVGAEQPVEHEVEPASAEAVAAPTQTDEIEEQQDAPDVETASEDDFVEDENDIVPGQRDADVEAFFAKTDAGEDASDDSDDLMDEPEAPVAVQETPAPQGESIAAKLQRIRAVVARQDDAEDEDDYAEDQHADASDTPAVEPKEDTSDDLMADTRRDIEAALHADEDHEMASDETEEEDDDDDIAAILSRLDAADDAENAEQPEDIISEAPDDAEGDDALDNLFGTEEAEQEAPAARLMGASEKASADPLPVDDEGAPRPAPRARVIKVKRADLEAAIERGELEEYSEDTEAEADVPSLDDLAPARTATSSLSPEDEAELARELAALEADISFDGEDDPEDLDDLAKLDGNTSEADAAQDKVGASGDDAARGKRDQRELPSIDDDAGDDMNRLMAETDQQMEEPESATRRNAFTHLRAAVAAKKADVAMGASDKGDDEDNAYRNDLADVVRPRRPVSAAARTERPGEARPAPLKLVAEQRIDVDRARPAGPVRPRRVAAVADATPDMPAGESFAEYAAEMGATKLPQLLEAAASYMSFVEGREQFSRPQLMTKVRQVGPEEGFSREDGLRSFGQLLRAGKIEKIKGGRFTVSDDIGYQPDHRAAG